MVFKAFSVQYNIYPSIRCVRACFGRARANECVNAARHHHYSLCVYTTRMNTVLILLHLYTAAAAAAVALHLLRQYIDPQTTNQPTNQATSSCSCSSYFLFWLGRPSPPPLECVSLSLPSSSFNLLLRQWQWPTAHLNVTSCLPICCTLALASQYVYAMKYKL